MSDHPVISPNPAPPHVYTAINRVQAALTSEGITKSRKNQQQGFSFRGIDDVLNALSPMLAKEHLCILPRVTERICVERQAKSGGDLLFVTLRVEFDFVSSDDGSKHTLAMYGEAMDSGDKATNKAMSAAYKYAAIQAFCIPTEGDNDADATTHQVAPQAKPAPAAKSVEKPAPAAAAKTAAAKADAPMSAATKAKLAEFRKTEDGERLTIQMLTHWRLVDFSDCTEKEAQEAVKWITGQLIAIEHKKEVAA